MSAASSHVGPGSAAFDALVTAVLDGEGTVVRWSRAAAELLGYDATEVCGRPVRDLLADGSGGACPPARGSVRLNRRQGGAVEVAYRAFRLAESAESLVVAAPNRRAGAEDLGASLVRALFSQDAIGVVVHGPDLALLHAGGLPAMPGGAPVPPGARLRDFLVPEDADDIEASLRQVLESGAPLIGGEKRMRSPLAPGRERFLRMSAVRLEDEDGRPMGVAAFFTYATGAQRARSHLDLLREAAIRVGGSLDVARTAQELAETIVPGIGDLGIVDLAEAVLTGDEPPHRSGGGDLHLRAVASATGQWPGRVRKGDALPPLPDHPSLRTLQRGKTIVMTRDELLAVLGDRSAAEALLPEAWHSLMIAPLYARGSMLGDLQVWRVADPEPFTREDTDLVTQIASRGALAIDNARRYTREHRAAVALQQSLLPRATTDTPAAETAGLYRPAGGGAEIGGDWFDAIPLPSLRLALVVGDVAGRGLRATVAMGRLRAAIHTLADLEPDPGELLTRLDALVQRLAAEVPAEIRDTVTAACLYVVYDPVTCQCMIASAGQLPPVVVRPDGTEQEIRISPGPPLGVGGMPFEVTTVEVEPGSLIALHTKGLVIGGDRDLDAGLRRLTDSLRARSRTPLRDTGRAVLGDLGELPRGEDVTLLLTRTRAVQGDHIASWDFPADLRIVAEAREKITRQLAAWGLDELSFTTELVVSELVTNAVRYAGGPVGLRLIREDVLVCEVTDPGNTQPRLRQAGSTDEGGRGLFLVAQLTSRWGCRYGQTGKTIWTEQPLDGSDPAIG
ncbi:magnesium or manganese-dependent protein phosphatase [Streptomyces davaonensis JCM 4913]|uniref:Magnesium or manganese-dependent protein phosphatase n=1 Tax=Streptomyces davaonensis (strain DSM 101723 / JCM 4913 / KCC S-0913 / 768) TaxID=1214101 RepID=K4RGT9_STRDJ|nr:SpoIIE family protein phosphatase [Streptomyces davaonensis]CCK32469.1 magnesium or manganese-dependent protein phosphatase [Streptomyces davaonensis JCM 4913]